MVPVDFLFQFSCLTIVSECGKFLIVWFLCIKGSYIWKSWSFDCGFKWFIWEIWGADSSKVSLLSKSWLSLTSEIAHSNFLLFLEDEFYWIRCFSFLFLFSSMVSKSSYWTYRRIILSSLITNLMSIHILGRSMMSRIWGIL
jgi:hypothetical protein